MTAHIVVDTTCAPDECVRRILSEDNRVATACMVSSLNMDESLINHHSDSVVAGAKSGLKIRKRETHLVCTALSRKTAQH